LPIRSSERVRTRLDAAACWYAGKRGPFCGECATVVIATHTPALHPVQAIVLGFGFVPALYAFFIVAERENAAKHQQLVSGVSVAAYWLSTLAWDLTVYMAPCCTCALTTDHAAVPCSPCVRFAMMCTRTLVTVSNAAAGCRSGHHRLERA
jgi:hypothetical protein